VQTSSKPKNTGIEHCDSGLAQWLKRWAQDQQLAKSSLGYDERPLGE